MDEYRYCPICEEEYCVDGGCITIVHCPFCGALLEDIDDDDGVITRGQENGKQI